MEEEMKKNELKLEEDKFCRNCKFRQKVINLLYEYLFKEGKVNEEQGTLEEVYCAMEKNLNKKNGNDDGAKLLYPMDANVLKEEKICRELLSYESLSNSKSIYAGHDLPVWLGDRYAAKIRLMVISQDPRRNEKEMKTAFGKEVKEGITLSTPFGLHNLEWRSDLSKGLPIYLGKDLIKEYGSENLCVYYTDFYKLRGVDQKSKDGKKSKLDTKNKNLYTEILLEELKLFNPNIVLLVGSEVKNAWKRLENKEAWERLKKRIFIKKNAPDREALLEEIQSVVRGIIIVETPHPSPRSTGWNRLRSENKKCNAENKLEFIKKKVRNAINDFKGEK